MACPFSSYYCKSCGSNCALSMKSYLKSSQMTIARNGVWKCKSRTSERCKNKIHGDVNVSLIEREEMGQDKWSELIKWDEMSQPLRHLGVDFISPSPLYGVVSTNQPQVTTASAVMMGSMYNNKKKKRKKKKSICSSHQAWTKTTRSPCSELQTEDNPSKNTWLI